MISRPGTRQTPAAVVLAAGQGTRLLPLTERLPKCLVEVNGTPILHNALRALAAHGVQRTRIVVGHLAEMVRARIPETFDGMRVEFVHNPDYATTNSMYSLALGLDGLDEGTWVLEGDIYFDAVLLDARTDGDISWLVDPRRHDLDGAFVYFDGDRMATRLEIVRNGAAPGAGSGKSVGVLRMSPGGAQLSRDWLKQGIADGKSNLYYDLIFAERLASRAIQVCDVEGARWFEIDTPGDLARAEDMFR